MAGRRSGRHPHLRAGVVGEVRGFQVAGARSRASLAIRGSWTSACTLVVFASVPARSCAWTIITAPAAQAGRRRRSGSPDRCHAAVGPYDDDG
ncbi:hypothetical protein ACIBQ1_32940 [Nonomuraea sp. NPDC050153]|uniref:hypothetical protein n=1 Tax=Nonomuraea sp. NPDC050153 TaxID=3364359 RepID=UPI003793C45C